MSSVRKSQVPKSNEARAAPMEKPPVAFEVKLDDGLERPGSAGPARLRKNPPKNNLTLADYEDKLRKAEERRNAKQAERVKKIHTEEEKYERIKSQTKPLQNGEAPVQHETKPFDENEIVPALRNKTNDSVTEEPSGKTSTRARQKCAKTASQPKNTSQTGRTKTQKKL